MNVAKILLAIIVVITVAAVVIYLMGQFEVTRPLYEQITGPLGNLKDQAVTFFSNPLTGITGAIGTVGGVTAAAGIYSTLKGKLTTSVNTANAEISNITSAKDAAEKKLASYEASAKTTVQGYESKISELEQKIKNAPNNTQLLEELETQKQKLASSQLQREELERDYKNLQIRYDELSRVKSVP